MSTQQFGTSPFGTTFSADPVYSIDGLITSILRSTGQVTTDTTERARCLEFLNSRYIQILKGRHWRFMERQLVLNLLPLEETGTVAFTKGTRAITGTGTSFDATMVNQKFIVASNRQAYRIEDVNSTTDLDIFHNIDLDTATASAYKIGFDLYEIPQDIAAVRSLQLNGHGELPPTPLQEFRVREAQNPSRTGRPEIYTLTEIDNTSGQYKLQFYPIPDKRYTVTVDYTLRPNRLEDDDDCHPLIPDYHKDVLYYAALADMYRGLSDPTNERTSREDARISFGRLAADQEMTDSRARLQPKFNQYDRARGRKFKGFYGLKWFGLVD